MIKLLDIFFVHFKLLPHICTKPQNLLLKIPFVNFSAYATTREILTETIVAETAFCRAFWTTYVVNQYANTCVGKWSKRSSGGAEALENVDLNLIKTKFQAFRCKNIFKTPPTKHGGEMHPSTFLRFFAFSCKNKPFKERILFIVELSGGTDSDSVYEPHSSICKFLHWAGLCLISSRPDI